MFEEVKLKHYQIGNSFLKTENIKGSTYVQKEGGLIRPK